MDITKLRCMAHVSTSNQGSACAGCTQHAPFPMGTPAQGKEGFWDYVRVHVCDVAAYRNSLFLSWPLTFGDNYWKGRDYQLVQGFSFKLCRSWLNQSICCPAFLGPCCVWGGGHGGGSSQTPCPVSANGEMQPGSVLGVGWKNRGRKGHC